MTGRSLAALIVSAFSLVSCPVSAPASVQLGQLDDFAGSNPLGWSQGANSPNEPVIATRGGPKGTDGYLVNASSGQSGPGGKQVMFNTSQWAGNYVSAGVSRIDVELANFGTRPLQMRIAFKDVRGSEFASISAVSLPVDHGVWHAVSFPLTASALQRVTGSDSLSTALSSVSELRILSASSPNYMGDDVPATLGVDEIRASAVPEPAAAAVLLIAAGRLMRRTRRAQL